MQRGGPPTGGGSSTVAFSASLAALPLKYLFKTLGCCAKISPEVLIEAHPSSGLRIKAVNQNHSAFLSCILRTNAFDGYECCAVEKAADKNDDDDFVVTGVQTALLAKHVLGCLRSNRVDRSNRKMEQSNRSNRGKPWVVTYPKEAFMGSTNGVTRNTPLPPLVRP